MPHYDRGLFTRLVRTGEGLLAFVAPRGDFGCFSVSDFPVRRRPLVVGGVSSGSDFTKSLSAFLGVLTALLTTWTVPGCSETRSHFNFDCM